MDKSSKPAMDINGGPDVVTKLIKDVNDVVEYHIEISEETADDDNDKGSRCCDKKYVSQRWILAYLGLWLGTLTFLISSNMSVAIVCMVKTVDVQDTFNKSELEVYNRSIHYGDIIDNETSLQSYNVLDVANVTEETVDSNSDTGVCVPSEAKKAHENERAEFWWNKQTQSLVLSAYFYGYLSIQIPAGWLATHFGGRRVVGIGMAVSCLATLLTPVLARTSVYLVFIARLLQGICNGMNSPAYCGLVGVWALPKERSRFLAMMWFGQMAGAVAGISSAGVLCAHGFDNGWASVFYVHGMTCVMFVVFWWYFVYNTPDQHPRIGKTEKRLLLEHYTPIKTHEKVKVPLRHILTYRPIYAMFIANMCDCWTFYMLFTCLPQFMKDVLLFDIQSNGLFSCLPFFTLMCGIAMAGITADYLRSKNIFSITNIRKIFQCSAFIGVSAFIVIPGYMKCDERVIVIVCLCMSTFIGAMGMTAGYSCNSVDIAPRFASVIFGLTNMLGSIPGIVAPMLVAEMTKNETSEEWRNVFFISFGVALLGALVYGLFANSEIAPWAKTYNIDLQIDSPAEDTKLSCALDTKQKETLA
ncbi:hypothetical protein ACF0H5_017475 [Mactra antiquata]